MAEIAKYSGELQFLENLLQTRDRPYRNASWLKSCFSDDVWECTFSAEHSFRISFAVTLPDGKLLTSGTHRATLEVLKCWLCVQTHPHATGGHILAPRSAMNRVVNTLHIIDYILLNADALQITRHGLAMLTESDVTRLAFTLSSASTITESIYQWSERLTCFLREKSANLKISEINQVLNERSSLSFSPEHCSQRNLALSESELTAARVWLWTNGFYKTSIKDDFRFGPKTEKLAEIIFANTLRGKTAKPVPSELLVEPIERYEHEFEPAPVTSDSTDCISGQRLSNYLAVIRRMGLLASIGLAVPVGALRSLDSAVLSSTVGAKPTGRFKTLPQHVVLNALRNAIEFALRYGDDLISAYLSLVKAAKIEGMTCIAYGESRSIEEHLTPSLKRLGVESWSVETNAGRLKPGYKRLSRQDYFNRFRRNPGLWELLRVFYGAVQICVGTLMARRAGELEDLIAGQCLDQSETRLIFENRKSGTLGFRNKTARPIPDIAVQLIKQLQLLQQGLIEQGLISKNLALFSFPAHSTNSLVSKITQRRLSESLDFFCDYFETELNENGQRYYIRQHQLRRFFAMLFFWGRSFGGLDTLRWFLGHTDIEQLYHYITESTPGEVLCSAKANYGSDLVRNFPSESDELSNLVEQHFRTRNFTVLDYTELTEYIEDLLLEGTVEIEPEFFDAAEGKKFRIAVKVHHKDLHAKII